MYAIIETGGKQVKVEVGQQIFVEKLDVAEGDSVTFDKVLLVVGEKTVVGKPFIKGATVVAKIEKQGKGPKIKVLKYKSKANYHKLQGHRQPYSRIIIDAINA